MKTLRPGRRFRLALCLLLPLTAALACGPDFSPDVFVRKNRPDVPAEYVAGKLGLLQPSFARADLIVAYRYLTGGTLDPAEQKGWSPTYSAQESLWSPDPSFLAENSHTAVDQWMAARRQYPGAPKDNIQQEKVTSTHSADGGVDQSYFTNCQDDAFTTAVATLKSREAAWGKASANLKNWLQAQDMVFANCAGGPVPPAAAPPGSPALLVSDRAYQIAAAHFYEMHLNRAHREFVAISKDKSSPWQPIAGYLAARTLVRQAFFTGAAIGAPSGYNPDLMVAAAEELKAYLAAGPPPGMQKAAKAELALIDIRTYPTQRARQLSSLLTGPQNDPDYGQNLKDLLWFISKNTPDGLRAQPDDEGNPNDPKSIEEADAARVKAYDATKSIRQISPLIDWTLTYESLDPAAANHALNMWQKTKTMPWLVAALALMPDNATPAPALMAAAADVPMSSSAWTTVSFHRVRLLLASGQTAQARAALSKALPYVVGQAYPSSINAFHGWAMRGAETLDQFLVYAPRTMLLNNSQAWYADDQCRSIIKQNKKRHYNCVAVGPQQIDEDTAKLFNYQFPLPVWLVAAQSPSLPAHVRQAIAMDGWTRAVLLDDKEHEAAFLLLLPSDLQTQAQNGSGLAPLLALVGNPGLSPYLNGGTQRNYSYDFVESYSDNWCYDAKASVPGIEPTFLNATELKNGKEEAAALAPVDESTLGRRVLDYVTANPKDPRAAEALYLILRMVRYGCASPISPKDVQDMSWEPQSQKSEAVKLFELRKDASKLLRERYASSPWTKKAGPIAG